MDAGDAGAEKRGDWIKTNQGTAYCIVAAAIGLLIYLGLSEWTYRELRDGFRLGFFTVIAAFAILVCALTMIVDRHRHHTDAEMAQTRWIDWVIAISALVVCYIYFELAWRLDYILVTPIFLSGATYVLGIRPLRSAIIASLVITAIIYGLFRLIGIELPTHIVGL